MERTKFVDSCISRIKWQTEQESFKEAHPVDAVRYLIKRNGWKGVVQAKSITIGGDQMINISASYDRPDLWWLRCLIINPNDSEKIVAFATTPKLVSLSEYEQLDDKGYQFHQTFDSTMLMIFRHGDEVIVRTYNHDAANSFFQVEGKSHETMLKEVLSGMYPDVDNTVKAFADDYKLDADNVYFFALVHRNTCVY
jgi:hypothetical protein